MATSRVTELLSLINNQIEVQEVIMQHALDLAAMIKVATHDSDFLNHPKWVIHSYLCAIGSIVDLIKVAGEDDIDLLLNTKRYLLH